MTQKVQITAVIPKKDAVSLKKAVQRLGRLIEVEGGGPVFETKSSTVLETVARG